MVHETSWDAVVSLWRNLSPLSLGGRFVSSFPPRRRALIHLKWQIDFYPREWMILISRLLLFCQGSSTVLCSPVQLSWWFPYCSRAERGERVSIGLVLWSVSSIWFCRQGINHTNFGRFGLFGTFLSSLGFRWIYQISNAKVMGAHKIPVMTWVFPPSCSSFCASHHCNEYVERTTFSGAPPKQEQPGRLGTLFGHYTRRPPCRPLCAPPCRPSCQPSCRPPQCCLDAFWEVSGTLTE